MTWGATDRGGGRTGSEAPDVYDPVVIDWPLAPRGWTQHEPIDTLHEYLEKWR